MAAGVPLHSRGVLLPLVVLSAIFLQVTPECDRVFVSRPPHDPQNGTFSAPVLDNPAGHARQCIYTFVAGPRQRVEVIFTSFRLRGVPPECIHEYMDVYAELVSHEASELVNSPFGGRYCGHIAPRRRISLHRALALGFYTDRNYTTADLFSGRYTFINDSQYEIGTPVPDSPCSFTVHASSKRQGEIVSPTYPGSYPKDLSCSYQFLGLSSQRVRIEFRDFDLFFGGPHCPFDYVKVYDGPTNESAVIGTYCGQQRNLVLYSSEAAMLVTFVTLQRTANTQNRGFKGIFEFSESFVKLDFIVKNDGEHIRGSECDQQILSKKESTGFVFSPNYPFPYVPKIVCRYFVYGMQDSQHLERVRLEFEMFDIPKREKGDCTDGYLKVYLRGQEATDSYDKFDHELCGENVRPKVVVSDGPRLVMVFSSGEQQGRGFKARYTFETEYRIPGTAAPDGSCSFTYRSSSRKKGDFNSPRYPSNYPSDTNCSYLFLATPNEQVTLVFDHFKVRADRINESTPAYGLSLCLEDWLEMYNIYRDGSEKLIGRYCSTTAPGPVESNRAAVGLKILLHSDRVGVFSGFKARYNFEVAKSIFGDCGSNVSSVDYGVIASPNFPQNYDGPSRGLSSKTCNWYISVRPKHKILLNFEYFAVEGNPATRGCPAAVVRLWHRSDSPPIELCGEKTPEESQWQFLSDSNSMRLSFISADKSVGAQGFRAVWTEVQEVPSCDQFTCAMNSFCISSRLRCNREPNCGANDRSDETGCAVERRVDGMALAGAAVAGAALFLLGGCVLCRRRRRRRRQRPGLRRGRGPVRGARLPIPTPAPAAPPPRHLHHHHPHPPAPPPPQPQPHICDELGERFANSVDSV